jgi:hypothetical protein
VRKIRDSAAGSRECNRCGDRPDGVLLALNDAGVDGGVLSLSLPEGLDTVGLGKRLYPRTGLLRFAVIGPIKHSLGGHFSLFLNHLQAVPADFIRTYPRCRSLECASFGRKYTAVIVRLLLFLRYTTPRPQSF